MKSLKKTIEEVSKEKPWTGRLIAVSKGFESKNIWKLHQEGQKDFAENYVDELLKKQKELQDLGLNKNLVWHFIGQLQSNKVDKLVGQVEYIHSVDRTKVLIKINQSASQKGIVQKVLLQINLTKKKRDLAFQSLKLKLFFTPTRTGTSTLNL